MHKKHYPLITFIFIEILIAVLSQNNFIKHNSLLLSGLTAVFLIIVPILYYFFTQKKETELTFWFIIYSVFKVTPYIFQIENNLFEIIFRWKLYLNIAFLLLLIWKAFSFIRTFRQVIQQRDNSEQDAHFIISKSLKKSIHFEKLGKMIAFEICSFYYCFIKWQNDKTSENCFSGYRNSGVSAIYCGLMLVSIFEAIGFHVLLVARSKNLAITFLVLHAYILINLIGHLKAIFFRTHIILSQKIVIRYGLFETIEIPTNSILSIHKFEGDYKKSPELLKCALLGKLEPHNISLELKNVQNINLPFGIIKKPKKILFYIDNVNDFISQTKLQVEQDQNHKNE